MRSNLEFTAPDRWRRSELIVVGAICATTLAVCILVADRASLWFDEVFTIHMASLPNAEWLDRIWAGEINGGLHHLAIRLLPNALHDDLTALRLAAIVAWIVGIPAFYAIARRLVIPSIAVGATIVFTMAPMGLRHAMEVRMYSFASTAALICTILLIRYATQPSRSRAIAYGFGAGFALYTHLFLVFVVAAHLVALLVHPDRRTLLRRAVPGVALLILLATPFAVVVLTQGGRQISHIDQPSIRELYNIWSRFIGITHRPVVTGGHLLTIPGTLTVAMGSGLILARWRRPPSPSAWLGTLPLALAVVPIAGAMTVSWLVQPVLIDRYLVIVIAPLVLISAIAIDELRRLVPPRLAPVPIGLGLLAAVSMLPGLWGVLSEDHMRHNYEDWREAGAYIASEFQPGDIVATTDTLANVGFLFHLDDVEVRQRTLAVGDFERGVARATGPSRVWVFTRGYGQSPRRAADDIIALLDGEWSMVAATRHPVHVIVWRYEPA
jgi:mannosyltransferase